MCNYNHYCQVDHFFKQLSDVFSSVWKKKSLLPPFKNFFDTWISEIVILEDNLMEDNVEIIRETFSTHLCPVCTSPQYTHMHTHLFWHSVMTNQTQIIRFSRGCSLKALLQSFCYTAFPSKPPTPKKQCSSYQAKQDTIFFPSC